METTETSLLISNPGVRFEQMGNADAESTVAPLPAEIVGGRFQDGTPERHQLKFLFRNMTSSTIVSETRNSL
jgi:hypothetical protein